MGGTWVSCLLLSPSRGSLGAAWSTPLLELEVLRERPGGARREGWSFEVMLGRGGVDAPLTCGQWRLLRPTQQLGGSEPSPRPGALTPVLSPQPPWQPPTPETHTHTPHGSTWAYRELEGEKNWVHKARDPGPSQAMSAPRTPQTLSSAVQGPRACAGSCEASSCKPAGAELRMSVPDNPERRPPCRPPDPLEDRPSPRMPHGDTWGCLPLSRAWRQLQVLGAPAGTQILLGPWGWGLDAAVSSRS